MTNIVNMQQSGAGPQTQGVYFSCHNGTTHVVFTDVHYIKQLAFIPKSIIQNFRSCQMFLTFLLSDWRCSFFRFVICPFSHSHLWAIHMCSGLWREEFVPSLSSTCMAIYTHKPTFVQKKPLLCMNRQHGAHIDVITMYLKYACHECECKPVQWKLFRATALNYFNTVDDNQRWPRLLWQSFPIFTVLSYLFTSIYGYIDERPTQKV